MKEEDFIRKKYGSGNPFKVPEGYFEQFTSELMSKLPEKEMKPVLSMPPADEHACARYGMLWPPPCAVPCFSEHIISNP